MLRSTALALSYSATEYACPVWGRSAHTKSLDPVLNNSCRIITGCLKSTNTNSLYLLAGIAPPGVRRDATSRAERLKQVSDPNHMLCNHQPANVRLKSRKGFPRSTSPREQSIEQTMLQMSQNRLAKSPVTPGIFIEPAEALTTRMQCRMADLEMLESPALWSSSH